MCCFRYYLRRTRNSRDRRSEPSPGGIREGCASRRRESAMRNACGHQGRWGRREGAIESNDTAAIGDFVKSSGNSDTEWTRPKSERVLIKVTGILITLFYYKFERSYVLPLLSCISFKAIVLVRLAPSWADRPTVVWVTWKSYKVSLLTLLYFSHGSGFSHTTEV